MVRKNKKTIILAKIRVQIRSAIVWDKKDKGSPQFWSSEDYKHAKKVPKGKIKVRNYPYYTKSAKAIEEIAEKIYKLTK